MKVLVTGASGLLGRRVFKRLKESPGLEVIGTCFSRTSNKELVKLDITDKSLLSQFFDQQKPEAIVHCAAERRPDVVQNEPAKAHELNVEATRLLCDLARKFNSWLLYISTDYVFDGADAPYKESSLTNPLNTYGKTKLAGEKVALAKVDGAAINAVLRVPILYGPIEYIGESAVTILYDKVKDSSTRCTMDHRQRRYPTHTDSISETIYHMLVKHQQQKCSLTGIYQVSDTRMLTKYDMTLAMAQALNLPADHIQANTSEPGPNDTPRPHDCQLLMEKIQQADIPFSSRNFDTEIKSIISAFLESHKS